MKRIEVILRTECVERVVRRLRESGVPRLTITHVHALGSGVDPEHYRLSFEEGAAYTEKAKITLVVKTELVPDVVELIRTTASTGHRGDGVIFVCDIERVVKIRTGEENALALL